MLPEPETVDWTTPWPTVMVRPVVVVLPEAGPTTSTAATIAPTQRAPRSKVGHGQVERAGTCRSWGGAIKGA